MVFLKAIYKYWMKFAEILGTINGFIILTVFYFLVIGCYALLAIIIKSFFKEIKPGISWKDKAINTADLNSLKLQF